MTLWLDAAPAASRPDETVLGVVLAGTPIAISRLGEAFFALHDLCPHGAARLADGYVDDVCVERPLHQGLVDIRSGAAKYPPITEATRTYPTRVAAGMVQVKLGSPIRIDPTCFFSDTPRPRPATCSTPVRHS